MDVFIICIVGMASGMSWQDLRANSNADGFLDYPNENNNLR